MKQTLTPQTFQSKFGFTRFFLWALIFLTLPLFTQAQQTIKHTKSSNIPYLEHLPSDYNGSNKNYPLLIFLHGTGEKGDGSDAMVWDVARHGPPKLIQNGDDMSFNVNGKTHSFIVISPQLTYSNSGWSNEYIEEVVKYALATYRVDLSRIYLTGLSLGGGGVWRYAGLNPELFAAIAPIAATQSVVISFAKAMANENLPVWAFHGDADNVVDVATSRGWVDKINSYQPDLKAQLTVYKGVGHDSWNRAYDPGHSYQSPNLYEWLLSYSKGNVDQPAPPPPAPPSNQPPSVYAGQDQTATLPVKDLTLQGSASDKDGSIAKYQWEEVSGPTQASLSGSTSATAKVNNLAAGEYQFKLTATDDKGASASDVVNVRVAQAAPPPSSPSDCGCDYTIPEGQHITDGKVLGIKPGDVICLQAGLNYNALKLINIVGSADKPVIIKNCGGKVSINVSSTFAIKTNYCQYFRITGSGDAKHEYGIELAGANSLGLSLDMLSSNFEVDHVEIHHVGFAGIMAKTDPSCEVPSGRDKFTMREVKIHDNYIHDTNGEGMYIGNSFYAKGVDLSCGTVLPHAVVNAKVYNNVVRNTGWDGIQVGAATQGCEVYNNEVENYGLRKNATHGNGIQLGEGTGGLCYNNIIKNGHWNGLQVLGYGDNVIFNNMVINTGNNGSFIDSRPPASPGNGFKFLNNTIVNPGANGVLIYASAANLSNEVKNNIIINPGIYDEYEKDPSWKSGKDAYVCILSPSYKNTDISNNFTSRKIDDAQFVDSKKEDFHLKASSPAINIGTDLSKWGVKFDFEYKSRPQGGSFDAGAYEYGGSSPANQSPVANAGQDVTVKLPVAEITLDGSKSYDPDGSVVSFSWKQINGPGISLSDGTSSKLKLNKLVKGSYKFQLTVTDNNGKSASDEATITVTESSSPNDGSGLLYKYYEGTWSSLPNFSSLKAVKSGSAANFDLSPRNRNDNFGFHFEGYIEITKAGDYSFYTSSDDGSKLYINGKEIVNNDGQHGTQERAGKLYLESGYHAINVVFFEKDGNEVLDVQYAGPGIGKQTIPNARLSSQKPSAPTSQANGLSYLYFEGSWNKLPDFSKMKVEKSGNIANFSLSPRNRNDNFGFRFDGYIEIVEAGKYTFYTTSDDGSELYINGKKVVANDGLHGAQERAGKVKLSAGYHAIRVKFFEGQVGETLAVEYKGPGINKQAIPNARLFAQKPGNADTPPSDNKKDEIVKFYLVDPASNKRMGELKDESEVILGDGINIEAVTDPAKVGSVKFTLNNKTYQVENTPPYALGGDKKNNFSTVKLKKGKYTLRATPYSQANGKGEAGKVLQIKFTAVNGKKIDIGNSRTAEEIAKNSLAPAAQTLEVAKVFPNPIENEVHVLFNDAQLSTKDVAFKLFNTMGVEYKISAANYSSDNGSFILDFSKMSLSAGVYFIYIIYNGGQSKEVHRVVKH